jgi:hypothetical protein
MNDRGALPPTPETGPEPTPAPSPTPCTTGWERIVATGLVSRGPVLFWGIVLSDAASIVATVYDGINALGRPVCSVQNLVAVVQTVPMLLPRPILLQDGLFVVLSAAPDDCLVLFDPLPNG